MAAEPTSQSDVEKALIILSEALAEQARWEAAAPRWLFLALFLTSVLVLLTLGATAGAIIYRANRDAGDGDLRRLELQVDFERERSRASATSTSVELQLHILRRLERLEGSMHQLEDRFKSAEPQSAIRAESTQPVVSSSFSDQGVPVVPVRRHARGAFSIQLESAPALSEQEKSWLELHNPWGVPAYQEAGNRTLLIREGWTGSHNNTEKISDWISHLVSAEHIGEGPDRTDDFRDDPKLQPEYRAFDSDYGNQGGTIHRGHQCPAEASTGRGMEVMSESFFMSNMTPQNGSLNSGKWRALEDRIGKWCASREALWVITGPAYVDDDGDGEVEFHVIGNGVYMPSHYFKIIVDKDGDEFDAIAFLIENEKPISGDVDNWLTQRIKSIDEIEEITGLDFIPGMSQRVEEDLEARKPTELWQ